MDLCSAEYSQKTVYKCSVRVNYYCRLLDFSNETLKSDFTSDVRPMFTSDLLSMSKELDPNQLIIFRTYVDMTVDFREVFNIKLHKTLHNSKM